MSSAARLAVACLLAAAALAIQCKHDRAAPAPHAISATPAPAAVTILVDEHALTSSVMLGRNPRPLTELVTGAPALDTWLALEAIDSVGKVHTTMTPARTQAGKVPMLAMTTDGVEVGFGAPGGTGPLAEAVFGVTRVTIKVQGDKGAIAAQVGAQAGDHGTGDSGGQREHADEGRPSAGPDLKIAITGASGESEFTGDRLAALPVIKAPSGDTETPGWSLIDVLAAVGIDKPQVVHLTDGEGATLRLDASDFDPTKVVLYLKLNRSGVIRFRVFRRVGETWEVGGELRGITKIQVLK